MPKTYDEKRDAFDRMVEGRLPKAVRSIELLSNLARKSDYAWTNAQLQDIIDQLDDAVDTVMEAFGVAADDVPASDAEAVSIPAEDRPDADASSAGAAPYIEGMDKRDIRKAYKRIAEGHHDAGMGLLRSVILGWPVPDKV